MPIMGNRDAACDNMVKVPVHVQASEDTEGNQGPLLAKRKSETNVPGPQQQPRLPSQHTRPSEKNGFYEHKPETGDSLTSVFD